MRVQITREGDQYAAKLNGGSFVGASPDEALGYAIREHFLARGVPMKNGDLVVAGPLQIKFLEEPKAAEPAPA